MSYGTSTNSYTLSKHPQRHSGLLPILFTFGMIVIILWLVTAGAAWMFRNPCGNETTFITHFKDALCFRKLPQFQERVIK